jgi:hypothetical protein
MIQRIQSVWLLLAALVSAGLFVFGILSITYTADGAEVTKSIKLLELNTMMGYLLAIIAIAVVALPLIAIFMFKNRKLQMNLALLALVLNVGFIAFYLMSIESYKTAHVPPVSSSAFGVASFMPVLSVIFLFLAMRGIRKDNKLVKSLERLR